MRSCARASLLAWLVALGLAPAASAVTIDWTYIGDPGNAADPGSGTPEFGAVGYEYLISTYEVTNAQYAEFLNAVASTDALELYSADMGSGVGGITRDGLPGDYTYSTISGREAMPVTHVSWYDALRFANWLNNGQGGAGTTETGAYTLLGGTPIPINGSTVTRDPGATIFLTSEDEWYKAAYYDAFSASYFTYPTRSNSVPICSSPSALPNRANCNNGVDLRAVGSYTGSASPYGTFDQGGNAYEWNETNLGELGRGQRGGSFRSLPSSLDGESRSFVVGVSDGHDDLGFRVATNVIPEPGTGVLVMAGLLGLASQRRLRPA